VLNLHDLRTDPGFQRLLLQIALETRAVLVHALEHGRVAPGDLQIVRYQRLGAKDEFDPAIRKEWSNGGYPLAKARGLL
jgi:hypothetical protein